MLAFIHDCILIYFLTIITVFESLRIVLLNMVTILMMSAKMALPGLFEINIFLNKSFDVKAFVHDVIDTILLRNSNYIVDAAT